MLYIDGFGTFIPKNVEYFLRPKILKCCLVITLRLEAFRS